MSGTSLSTTRFSEIASLVDQGGGVFTGSVDHRWTIGGNPNGGYLLAMMGRAAAAAGPHPHVAAVSAHYLRPPLPGPVTVEIEVLRAGRSASQLRARLVEDGRVCVEALITTTRFDGESTPYWRGGEPARSDVAQEDCIRLGSMGLSGVVVSIMDEVDVRLEPSSAGYMQNEPSGRGELRGWLALPAGEDFDTTSLVYAVDAFPPATLDVEQAGWVPTLELTVYVRALPAPGPVRVLQRAQLVDGQKVDEQCTVWDSKGRLVAQGTQLAAIRLGAAPSDT